MGERRGTDPTRAYALQPVRSRGARLGAALALSVAAAAAGAGVAWWALGPDTPSRCAIAMPGTVRSELADAQLKLEQERSARAALQKSADSAQAEIAKLRADLLFLRNQRGGAH